MGSFRGSNFPSCRIELWGHSSPLRRAIIIYMCAVNTSPAEIGIVSPEIAQKSFGLSPRAKSRGLVVVFAVGLSARRDSSTRCARSE